ncbi:YihY family inner membrane protein [Rhodovibrionaceae bacterium A322]
MEQTKGSDRGEEGGGKSLSASDGKPALLREGAAFLLYVVQRFGADGCTRQAAGLSYASLLALVPLLVIGLAVLSAFPSMADSEEQIKKLFYELLTPTGQEELTQYLDSFLSNARRMTAPGLLALGVTALLLLSNVNGALNAVWRVSDPRPIAMRFLVYWALLTLGPVLIGASLTISSFAFALVQQADSVVPGSFILLQRLLSVGLTAGGLALLYYLVPNRNNLLSHALIGGVFAALLLELLKFGFGLYVVKFPSYQAIYGALAAIPLFFIWMYLAWSVVLLGAEMAAAVPEWSVARRLERGAQEGNRKLLLALSLLARLREASRHGSQGLKPIKLLKGLPAWPEEADQVLSKLRKAGFLTRTSQGARVVLSRDLSTVTLGELCTTVGLGLDSGADWLPKAQAVMAEFGEITEQWRNQDLESLLADRDGSA